MQKLQTGDTVIVIAGKHKGKISTIKGIKEIINARKIANTYIYLDGVNVAKKAVKKQGFKEVILPLHISNVMYYSATEKVASRVKIVDENTKKVRVLKKIGKVIVK